MRNFRATTVKAMRGIGVIAALLLLASPVAAQELVTLATRDGVTQSFLLLVPGQGRPAASAVLFAGGGGNLNLRMENGQIKFGDGNFLVRSRQLFADGGVAAAVIDAPSDQATGMDDSFRLGDQHARDIAAVVAAMKKRFDNAPVFLIGTSRGTISAANGGRTLGNEVAGVILTSTVHRSSRRYGNGLAGFDYAKISAPLLFVHHLHDGCNVTPYNITRSVAVAGKYPLITVDGGKPAMTEPCESYSTHGYYGKEAETVGAMVNWMLRKPYRDNID